MRCPNLAPGTNRIRRGFETSFPRPSLPKINACGRIIPLVAGHAPAGPIGRLEK